MKKTNEMLAATHKRNSVDDKEIHESEFECHGCGQQFNGHGTLSAHVERCQKVLFVEEEEEEVRCACGSEYGVPNADDGRFYCNRGHGGAFHCAP